MAKSRLACQEGGCGGIYLCVTSLKGVFFDEAASGSGHLAVGSVVMFHRLREAWQQDVDGGFAGPIEIDETYNGR